MFQFRMFSCQFLISIADIKAKQENRFNQILTRRRSAIFKSDDSLYCFLSFCLMCSQKFLEIFMVNKLLFSFLRLYFQSRQFLKDYLDVFIFRTKIISISERNNSRKHRIWSSLRIVIYQIDFSAKAWKTFRVGTPRWKNQYICVSFVQNRRCG